MATSVSSPNGLQLAGWDLYRSRITGCSGSERSNGMVPPAEISAYAILALPQRLNRTVHVPNYCTCRMPLPSETLSALTQDHLGVALPQLVIRRAGGERGMVQASRSPGLRSEDDLQPSEGVVVHGWSVSLPRVVKMILGGGFAF
jgi:hypothetical protein